jgi:hypothetical protein|tara:strand:- start:4869 stop:5327 length:459 start_codon:yes stop_codon:yes gene_type:complete
MSKKLNVLKKQWEAVSKKILGESAVVDIAFDEHKLSSHFNRKRSICNISIDIPKLKKQPEFERIEGNVNADMESDIIEDDDSLMSINIQIDFSKDYSHKYPIKFLIKTNEFECEGINPQGMISVQEFFDLKSIYKLVKDITNIFYTKNLNNV